MLLPRVLNLTLFSQKQIAGIIAVWNTSFRFMRANPIGGKANGLMARWCVLNAYFVICPSM